MPEQSPSNHNHIGTSVPIIDIPGTGAVLFDGHFQALWHAYPGYGKHGQVGEPFKGTKAKAQAAYFQLIIKTKENDRETLIHAIADGAGRYEQFLKQSGGLGKHLSTWLTERGWEPSYAIDRTSADSVSVRAGIGQKLSYSDTIFASAGQARDIIRARDGGPDRPGQPEGFQAQDFPLPGIDRIAN